MRAEDFIQSIGVNDILGSSGESTSQVISEMSYLGVANMRVNEPVAGNLQAFVAAGNTGIKFDVITGSNDIASDIGGFDAIAGYTASIEGINEVNSYPFFAFGLSGISAATAFQAALYTVIRSDPALASIPVLPFSLSVGFWQTGYPDLQAYAQYGNIHAYTSGGGAPDQSIQAELALQETEPNEAAYLTEDGYYTIADGYSGVSPQYQAIGDLEIVLDGAADGLAKTFLYDLHDDGTGSVTGSYGLYDAYGNPKPAAYAIHNLTALLADPGGNASTFTPTTPNIGVAGLNYINGKVELFSKSDGTFDIALWSEVNIYNSQTGGLATISSPIAFTFDASYDVKVYDMVQGNALVQTATAVTSLTVLGGDDPLMIQLTPNSGSAAAAPAIPVSIPATPVSSPATAPGTPLQLGLSEDPGSTGVQYAISIDGVQVANSTVSARHSLGQNATVAIPAGDQLGTHVITVTLLNPSGGATTPNALYVDSISLGNVDTVFDTQLNAATPSVSYTVTNPAPSANGPITSDTVNGSSLPAAFLTTATPSVNSFGQIETRNAGAGTAQLELAGQQTAYAGTGSDNFIARAGVKSETVVFGFNSKTDTIHLAGYNIADPNNAIFQNGTTETIQLVDGNAIDLVHTSGLAKTAFTWG